MNFLGAIVFFLNLLTLFKVINSIHACAFLIYLLVVLLLIKETWSKKERNKQKKGNLIFLVTGKSRKV